MQAFLSFLLDHLAGSIQLEGLPRWCSSKEPTCQCRGLRFDPWVRKFPWRRKWQSPPVFLPGKSHRQRSLAGCSGVAKESDMTWRLSHHHHTAGETPQRIMRYFESLEAIPNDPSSWGFAQSVQIRSILQRSLGNGFRGNSGMI